MARILYIGDEVTALGFRLAGVETRVTEPTDAAAGLREALATDLDCVLVMVGLAEGIAIYGLIVSILILNRLG